MVRSIQDPTSSLMAFGTPDNKMAKRQRAAQLLVAVLDEQIEPRIAINRWPETSETPDPSLNCAYQALWHFEADEEKQQTEVFYLDAQLELLRQIARFLQKGQDLPPYILKMYAPGHRIHFFYPLSAWEESCRLIRRIWSDFKLLWDQTWQQCLSALQTKR